MKEQDKKEFTIFLFILILLFIFIYSTSIEFIKNNPEEASNVIEAMIWYFKNLFSPIFGK